MLLIHQITHYRLIPLSLSSLQHLAAIQDSYLHDDFQFIFLFIIPQSQCDVKCPSSLLFCLSLMRVEMKCVVRGDVKTASWPPSSKQGGVGPGPATAASLCKLISGTHVLLWPSQTILQVGQGKVTVESWSNMMTR